MVDFFEYAASSEKSVRVDEVTNVKVLTGCLSGDPFKDIVDEGVKDGHSLVGDTGVRVYLLQHYKEHIRYKTK
jgi:tetrahydromethanopterin S-methyltransferase subunit A